MISMLTCSDFKNEDHFDSLLGVCNVFIITASKAKFINWLDKK